MLRKLELQVACVAFSCILFHSALGFADEANRAGDQKDAGLIKLSEVLPASAPLELSLEYNTEFHSRPQNWIKIFEPFDPFEVPKLIFRTSVEMKGRVTKSDKTDGAQAGRWSIRLSKLSIDDKGDDDYPARITESNNTIWFEIGDDSRLRVVECDFQIGPGQRELLCDALERSCCLSSSDLAKQGPKLRAGAQWPASLHANPMPRFFPELFEEKPTVSIKSDALQSRVEVVDRHELVGVDCFELLVTTDGRNCVDPFSIKEVNDEIQHSEFVVEEQVRQLSPVGLDSPFFRCRGVRRATFLSETKSGDFKGLKFETERSARFEVRLTPIE